MSAADSASNQTGNVDNIGDAVEYGSASTSSDAPEPTPIKFSYYKMDHGKRGLAVIFNHIFFAVDDLEPRHSSSQDCTKLQKTLQRLGFTVNVYDDSVCKDISKVLESVAKMDHTDHDCLVIAILTHGDVGVLYGLEDSYEADAIWSYFTDDTCPSLADKPKIFIVQACQGGNCDDGIELKETCSKPVLKDSGIGWKKRKINVQDKKGGSSSTKKKRTETNVRVMRRSSSRAIEELTETDARPHQNIDKTVADKVEQPEKSTFRIIAHPDWLIAWATIPEFYSWRNTASGSWFIQILCDELDKNATNCDILKILTSVSLRIAVNCISFTLEPETNRKKQIPCFTSTLTRLVQFTPRPQANSSQN